MLCSILVKRNPEQYVILTCLENKDPEIPEIINNYVRYEFSFSACGFLHIQVNLFVFVLSNFSVLVAKTSAKKYCRTTYMSVIV
jgi:hypothetical protein